MSPALDAMMMTMMTMVMMTMMMMTIMMMMMMMMMMLMVRDGLEQVQDKEREVGLYLHIR